MGDHARPITPRSPSKTPADHLSSPIQSPIQETKALVADEHPEEGDDFGVPVGYEHDTRSLTSSIVRYREENGRTYHAYKDGSYPCPNDEEENERLDIQHAIYLLTFDYKLHIAPMEKQPTSVLDAGCGTGIWCIEYADEHPEAQVTGIDLSPIQPAFVPPNVLFYVDDIEDDWEFSAPFDLVFARMMTGSIRDWPRFFRQSYDNLNPGGTIETHDIIGVIGCDDDTVADDCALKRWSVLLDQAFRGHGSGLDSSYQYPGQLSEAGFEDIVVVNEKWPTNRWPRERKYKQIGIWNQENMTNGLGALTLALFTRPIAEGGLGWSRGAVESLLEGVKEDLADTRIHAYWAIRAVYARKPGMKV